jgi:hypothetical protein
MLMCVRPIPVNGPSPLWHRRGRDKARTQDPARCLCGKPDCRDSEVRETR